MPPCWRRRGPYVAKRNARRRSHRGRVRVASKRSQLRSFHCSRVQYILRKRRKIESQPTAGHDQQSQVSRFTAGNHT
eukprot:scaffold516_cov175-Amphora_coffeaeformis.AAC.30